MKKKIEEEDDREKCRNGELIRKEILWGALKIGKEIEKNGGGIIIIYYSPRLNLSHILYFQRAILS